MEVMEKHAFVLLEKPSCEKGCGDLKSNVDCCNLRTPEKSPPPLSYDTDITCKIGELIVENGLMKCEVGSKNTKNDNYNIGVLPVVVNGHLEGTMESHVSKSSKSQISCTPNSLSQSEHSDDFDIIKYDSSEKKTKVKKRVNICTNREAEDEDVALNSIETVALRRGSETAELMSMSNSADGCLTMTGTIKRGKKAGQSVDVKLNMSREELEVLEASIATKSGNSHSGSSFSCGPKKGPHIILLTALCFPFAVIISSLYSFYVGTLTWYNVFTYYTEEKPVCCRIVVSPFLILLYPFTILIFTIGLGIYAGLVQISWFFETWCKEITDLEKGFYGWLCATLKHEDCSPYEVVVLTEIQGLDTGMTLRSSSEDSTL